MLLVKEQILLRFSCPRHPGLFFLSGNEMPQKTKQSRLKGLNVQEFLLCLQNLFCTVSIWSIYIYIYKN